MAKIGGYVWQALAGAATNPQAIWNLGWLGPTKWAGREPWFIQRNGTTLTGRSDTQTVRDKQIQNAFRCGFDFMIYQTPPNELGFLASGTSQMWRGASTGVVIHKTSAYAGLVKYCLNVTCGALVESFFDNGNVSDMVAYMLTLFADPNYQTVGAGRPLVFLWSPPSCPASFPGALRTACSGASIPNPYIVGDWSGVPDQSTFNSLGLDAMGVYSIPVPSANNQTFAAWHAASNTATWSTVLALGNQMVPSMSCGIDWRPISDVGGTTGSYWPPGGGGEADPGNISLVPTPAEFASAIKDAITFVGANPTLNQFGLITLYSIGENTECNCALEPDGIDFGMRYQIHAQSSGRQRDNRRVLRARGIRCNSR